MSRTPPATAWQGRWLAIRTQGRWEYAERVHGIAAAVIVAIDEGHVLLIEQYRAPLGRICLELPAGLVGDTDADESIEAAANRELEEETGYRAAHVERLGTFHSSPGMTSEAFDLVRATGLTRTGAGGGEEDEDITVYRIPLADVPAFVAGRREAGIAVDAKVLLLLGPSLLTNR
ncbi:NUDIX hydrolase [Sphingomonas sp.]|uniref:NUDIX hydrolase n=1 Tax=Sphingomonas sp. TaxID=28214 RepID=UPI002ED8291B